MIVSIYLCLCFFQITVLIKSAGNCASQRHYVATSRRLPGAFTDGSHVSGSVTVTEVDPGSHVEIHARFIATTVIIRKVAGFLTFAIQMPQAILNESSKTQLCVQGCPLKHRISAKEQVISEDIPRQSTTTSRNKGTLIKSHTKRAFDETKLRNSIIVESFTQISEEEARKLCKRIILGTSEDDTNAADETVPERRQNNTTNSDPKSFSSSLSSQAFSSLVPDSNRKSKNRGKKKHRTARGGNKPVNKRNRLSSFHQLLTSDDKTDDPFLSNSLQQPKLNKKNKRDVSAILPQNENSSCSDKITEEKFEDFNFYFESCVFDLVLTSDMNFTLSAKAALLDLTRTHALGFDAPGASLEVVKRWEPSERKCPKPPTGGANPKSMHFTLLLACVTFACVFTNILSISTNSSSNTVGKLRFNNRNLSASNRRTKTFSSALLGS